MKKLATTGILCSVSILILSSGIITPLIFMAILLAISALNIVLEYYGRKYWVMGYTSVSLISLMIVPDLEVSLTFVCMCWYNMVLNITSKVENKYSKWVTRITISIIASYIIYRISIFVFGADELDEVIPHLEVLYVILFSILLEMIEVSNYIINKLVVKKISRLLY